MKHRPAGHGHPLSGRVDQMAHFLDGEALRKIATALEGDDQYVAAANRAAIAGDLVAARRQCTAFGEGVGGVEQGVAEIVFGHDSCSTLSCARNASTSPAAGVPPGRIERGASNGHCDRARRRRAEGVLEEPLHITPGALVGGFLIGHVEAVLLMGIGARIGEAVLGPGNLTNW